MKVKCINTGYNKYLTLGKIYQVIRERTFINEGYFITADDGCIHWYIKGHFEIVKENKDMKELTFREVIANIKEGEVWESEMLEIFLDDELKEVVLKDKNGFFDCCEIGIKYCAKFTLKRNKVSFQEAFKAYEEGKEIESCVSETKYKKEKFQEWFKEKYDCWIPWSKDDACFETGEIRGEWYIN